MPLVNKNTMYAVASHLSSTLSNLPSNSNPRILPKNFRVNWFPKNANFHLPVAIGCHAQMNFPFLVGPHLPTSILHHHHVMYHQFGLQRLVWKVNPKGDNTQFSTLLTTANHDDLKMISCQVTKRRNMQLTDEDGNWIMDFQRFFDTNQIQGSLMHATRHEPDYVFGVISLIADVVNIKTGRSTRTRVLIDDGSNINVIERKVADRIGLTQDQNEVYF